MKKSIQFLGKGISYSVKGAGRAIVLLHGFLESKEIWDTFTEVLKNDFTVIAIDLPGHGESELISGNLSMEIMAESVKKVLSAENISQAVIAGHSMGGYVALHFAAENESLLNGLVLFHSHAEADSSETKANRERTINIVKQNKGGFIRQFIPDLFDQNHVADYSESISMLQHLAGEMSPDAIIAALSGMRDRESRLQYLSLAQIPVLFIIGKQDSRMSSGMILAQAVIPSHSEVLLLSDVGHMGFIEAPDITLRALKHFAIKCFDR